MVGLFFFHDFDAAVALCLWLFDGKRVEEFAKEDEDGAGDECYGEDDGPVDIELGDGEEAAEYREGDDGVVGTPLQELPNE